MTLTSVQNITPRFLGGLPVAKVSEMAPRFNALIYGNPSSGKTLLSASCDLIPEMRKVVLLDVDGGALTAKTRYPNIDRVEITADGGKGWKKLQAVYDDLAADASHGYQTVIIDTGTEAQKVNMMSIMDVAVKKAREQGQIRDAEVPAQREWGISSDQFRRMVRAYRDLPMNFILTCHTKTDIDQIQGTSSTLPDLPGKLAKQISGFFDIVLHAYVKEIDKKDAAGNVTGKQKVWCLLSNPTERIIAKDRTGKLPPVLSNTNMQKIWNLIHNTEPGDKK